jgi:hypothetical protein
MLEAVEPLTVDQEFAGLNLRLCCCQHGAFVLRSVDRYPISVNRQGHDVSRNKPRVLVVDVSVPISL